MASGVSIGEEEVEGRSNNSGRSLLCASTPYTQSQTGSPDDVQTAQVQQSQQVQSPQCIEFGQQTSFLSKQTVMDLTDSLASLNLMQNTATTSVGDLVHEQQPTAVEPPGGESNATTLSGNNFYVGAATGDFHHHYFVTNPRGSSSGDY